MRMAEMKAKCVLVVDDDAELLEAYRDTLDEAGYRVTMARCVREALEAMAASYEQEGAGAFDLVVSDVIMEEKDSGFYLCYRLKRDPATSGTPVLLLSSTRRDEGVRFSLRDSGTREWLSADDIMNKPVTPDELLLRVGRLLTTRRDMSA